jgi:hypothetical protein
MMNLSMIRILTGASGGRSVYYRAVYYTGWNDTVWFCIEHRRMGNVWFLRWKVRDELPQSL